ncbi:unnamed protein product [Ixodes pacificus]
MDVISTEQRQDRDLKQPREFPGRPIFDKITLHTTNNDIICKISAGTPRPFIPVDFRRQVFDFMQGLSQKGIPATQKFITERFRWPGINTEFRSWTRSCIQ